MNVCSSLKTIAPDQVCAFVGTGDYVEIPPDCTFFEGKPATYANLMAVLNQGAAEGLLPAGYTELEYLESSGTQYIDTGYIPNNETGLKIDALSWLNVDFIPFGCRNSGTTETRFYVSRGRRSDINETFIVWGRGWGAWGDLATGTNLPSGNPWRGLLNWRNSREASGETESFVSAKPLNALAFAPTYSLYLFAANIRGVMSLPYSGKITTAGISQGEKIAHDFIPALRKSDRVPGMWDSVCGQFYTNAGTGTFGYRVKATGETAAPFSLRDPYYTAPSGVYARPSGENELEILADTEEPQGEGWEWFANTAEAYEHFNITTQE